MRTSYQEAPQSCIKHTELSFPRWSIEEFFHTLFLPLVERELVYVEGVVDKMLGGMAEIASGLNHDRSIIGVDVKEIQKGPFS